MAEEFVAGGREKLSINFLGLFCPSHFCFLLVQWSSYEGIFSFVENQITEALDLMLYVQWFFAAEKEKTKTRLGFLFCSRREIKTLKGDITQFRAFSQ